MVAYKKLAAQSELIGDLEMADHYHEMAKRNAGDRHKAGKQREWIRERKRRLVAMFGGYCNRCKQTYPDCCFDFHHLDPAQKDRAVTIASWDKIVKEMDKCIMLCANCHRIVHTVSD